MLKLIVSDLDKTLLPANSSKLDKEVLSVPEALSKKGILFCVASGRSYAELKRLFADVQVPLCFICCDGGIGIYKEKTLFSFPIRATVALKQASENILAYGKYTVFASDRNLPFYRQSLARYFGHVLPLSSIGEKDVYKLAVEKGTLNETLPDMKRIYKDASWQEYINEKTSKGEAVKLFQQSLAITPDETLVFGDGLNDLSMLPYGESFYVGTSNLPYTKQFNHQTRDVLTVLKSKELL